MREIKFRARHKKYKIWLNVTAIDLENKTILIAEEITKDKKEYHTFTFDEIILEQCTCLKDKNGKEIYEGDVIKHYKENYIDRYEVYFDDIIAQYRIKSLSGMGQSDFCSFDYIVIGNIHENGDLL